MGGSWSHQALSQLVNRLFYFIWAFRSCLLDFGTPEAPTLTPMTQGSTPGHLQTLQITVVLVSSDIFWVPSESGTEHLGKADAIKAHHCSLPLGRGACKWCGVPLKLASSILQALALVLIHAAPRGQAVWDNLPGLLEAEGCLHLQARIL